MVRTPLAVDLRRTRRRALARGLLGALVLVLLTPAAALAYPRPGVTERVSVASDGTQGNFHSGLAGWGPTETISADGRYVTFHGAASNLVPGDTNGWSDVFVRDQATGNTERVSVASDGSEGDHVSYDPAISADGRYVAFVSSAANLVPGDTNGLHDVFVRDRATGKTERVSVASDGAQIDDGFGYFGVSISADGRHVAFARNDCYQECDGSYYGLFLRDRVTEVTEQVPASSPGKAAISADGRYVAFEDDADIFVYDRSGGTAERVSVASDGSRALQGTYRATYPAISADGRYVAFLSAASNLVPGDTNGVNDVFVRDRTTATTERVSVASDGIEGNASSWKPTISADGQHVAFLSAASNLVSGDTNGDNDMFVRDRATGTTERASVASDGTQGERPADEGDLTPDELDLGGANLGGAISGDGRHIVVWDDAPNLVPGDTNEFWDVFVRDRGPATGVGSVAVTKGSDGLAVSGWATFSGATVASADDPEGDGVEGARAFGAEIVGASVVYRHEREDLLLRLRLASLPGPVIGGAPGVVYRWALTVGGKAFEVRALRAAATATPPGAPYVALYECASLPICTEVRRLTGSIGTTGLEVHAVVPLAAVGAPDGAALAAVDATAGLGEAAVGPRVALDEVALSDTVVPMARVDLGIAPAGTAADQVTYTVRAALLSGRFSGTLPVSSLPAGNYRVWVRACLGATCGVESAEVRL